MQTDKETYHILVAEELPIVRDGLVSQLGQIKSVHIHTVSVTSMESLRSLLAVRPFHFVFVSPTFCDGFDVAEFARHHPKLPCVAVLHTLEQLRLSEAYYATVTIYDPAERLESLVLNYHDAETPLPQSQGVPDVLSEREKEILVHLARGLSNKQIADVLCLSVYTVMTHRRNICAKLGIHSVGGLTIYAIANKLIEM